MTEQNPLNTPKYTLGIVIPTYNEAENIAILIDRVKTEVEKYSIKTVILVMDDGSPDGTYNLVNEYIKTATFSEFLTVTAKQRPGKQGIASAYTQGFSILKPDCEFLLEMDADFSHKPEYIHEFLSCMDAGSDLVIGSRYINGGGVENWTLIRKLISTKYSLFCRLVLRVPVRDFTGGYNMFRASVFDTVKLDEIESTGFLFQIEMKSKVIKSGFSWMESPIIFPDRINGVSKFNKKVMLEAAIKIWSLA
jgi:dolichol-phosphate mannosyltransferase